jgi:hypothetical protein
MSDCDVPKLKILQACPKLSVGMNAASLKIFFYIDSGDILLMIHMEIVLEID